MSWKDSIAPRLLKDKTIDILVEEEDCSVYKVAELKKKDKEWTYIDMETPYELER